MSKITLNNVTTFQNDATAANVVNGNSTTVQTAFDNTLSRDGTSPNTMLSNLDMNSNQILNLPVPSTVNSPARLIDVVSNPSIVVPTTGTSGHTVPYLDTNNTWSGVNTYPANDLVLKGSSTGVTALNSANAGASNFVTTVPAVTDTLAVVNTAQTLTNKTLTTPIISQISNTGTVTLPTATDTLVGRQTTDTLTNKTISTSSNTIQVGAVTVSAGQYAATATNDSATAGNIGEFMTNTASGVAITSGVPFNVVSINLTAGDWDVWGFCQFGNGGTTTYSMVETCLSTVASTLSGQVTQIFTPAIAGAPYSIPTPMQRFSVASTTGVILEGQATYTTASPLAAGTIYARRAR